MEAAISLRAKIQGFEAEIADLTSKLAVSREQAAKAAQGAEKHQRDVLSSLLAEVGPLRAINTYTKQLAEAKEQLTKSKTEFTKLGYGEGNEGLLIYYEENFPGKPLPGDKPPRGSSSSDWRRGCWHILSQAKNSRTTALIFLHFYVMPSVGLFLILLRMVQAVLSVCWKRDPDEKFMVSPESMRAWLFLALGLWYAWVSSKEKVLYSVEKDAKMRIFSDAFNATAVAAGQALAAAGGTETDQVGRNRTAVDWLGWRVLLGVPQKAPAIAQPAKALEDTVRADSQFVDIKAEFRAGSQIIQIPDYTSPFSKQVGVKNRLMSLHSTRSDRLAVAPG